MNCQEVRNLLVAYLDNEVPSSERALIQAHLARCSACQQELAALSALRSRLSQFLQLRAARVTPSPQAWSRLQVKLTKEAHPSSSRLTAWLQRQVVGISRNITRIFQGGLIMKKGFAFAALAILVIALGTVAFVPSARAQLGHVLGWSRARWKFPQGGTVEIIEIQPNFTVLVPSYLPKALGVSNMMLVSSTSTGSAGIFFFGDPDAQWMQVTESPAPAHKPLPAGQEVTINGQKGVLITGLSGTLELGPQIPGDEQKAVKIYKCYRDGKLVECPRDMPLPEFPRAFTYRNAQRLIWYVGDTRIELLSNLPVEEVIRIAESFKPAETGEGKPPIPELPSGEKTKGNH